MRAGPRKGRSTNIGDWRSVAEVGFTKMTSTFLATRGERLVLGRFLISTDDERPDAFHNDVLGLSEINAENRVAACTMFELDDIDAAIAELDARYLAGEAAAHAYTWSVVAGAYARFNRHELPPMTPDSVSIDRRRLVTNEAVDFAAATRSVWDVAPDLRVHIEAVHRLSELGAVVTHVGRGTSPDGFDAEWRMILIYTVDGDLIDRCEIFDEADLDAALARFEELHPQTPRPENAASQVEQHFWAHFAAHDWDAMAELLSDDILMDDRRRVVRAGLWHGRDAVITNMRAVSEAGLNITVTVIATRGERLALYRAVNRDVRHEEFYTEMFTIVEIDADNKITAHIAFDRDNIDAAFEELDARYLAGEAAAHAHTWSLMRQGYAAHSRHEIPPATPRLGEYRSPARDRFRARRHHPVHPCDVGHRAGRQTPRRGGASADKHWSRRHPSGAWDLPRGLRGGVARARPFHI